MPRTGSTRFLLMLARPFAAFVFTLACGGPPRDDASTPSILPPRYAGDLPCLDCAAIRTRVSLFAGDTFLLEETYRGTAAGDRDYTSRGGWATLADAKDPAAGRILMLSPRVGQTRRFRMLGDSALRELDGSGRELAPGPIRVLYREP